MSAENRERTPDSIDKKTLPNGNPDCANISSDPPGEYEQARNALKRLVNVSMASERRAWSDKNVD